MERSRKIFRKIASASHHVVTAANEYADREDLNGVPLCHFQLEDDMRRISLACECLASIISKPPPEEGPAVDVRIQDWLNTNEPEDCLNTLSRMERLLQAKADTSLWMPRIFRRGRGSTATRDKINEAVDLFNSCKGCFRFLFLTEVWNNESATVQKQQDVPKSGDHTVQGESDVLEPSFPVPAQADVNTTALETAIYQDNWPTKHAVTQRKHKMKTDRQREMEEKQLEEISKWLDGLNCATKQDVTSSIRQEHTCKWLFDTTQYKMWRDGESGFLWLRGKPGAGKSVLASFVIGSFQESRREGEIIAYFYCDFRNERSTNSADVMRSILSQLLHQLRGCAIDPAYVFDDLIKAQERGGGTLSNPKGLAGFASRAARLFSQKPLVIVDALDECKDIWNLNQALMMIKDHVRLFVTSRPLHIIVDDLSGLPFVSMDDMADKLSADIELHVTRELNARRRLKDLDSGFKSEIHTVLCDKADGMFRWIKCSIDTLDRCTTRKEVRNALDSLPNGLDETYERILLAIDTEALEGQLAQRALIWLVAALRPLRLSEIMEALSINLQTRTLDSDIGPMHSGALLDACGSLVTYSEKTGIITLSHFSVKEYLTDESTRAKFPRYHVNWERAHLLLAQSCMCYISISLNRSPGPAPAGVSSQSGVSSTRRDQSRPMSQPLCDYVFNDALDHFGYLSGPTLESALHDMTMLAEDTQRHSGIWDIMCICARRANSSTNPCWPMARHDLLLYTLVAFAPNSFMSAFFRRTALKPKEGTNPLVYAAWFKKDEHARTLLLQGARLDHRGWEIDGLSQSLPIEVAFRNRHYAMVVLFVEEGSTVPPHIFTDLFLNPYEAKIPSSIARILLQTDESAEHINNRFSGRFRFQSVQSIHHPCHLLQYRDATEEDLVAIIRRFNQVVDGDHFAPRGSTGEAIFHFAVARGYLSVVQYLLTLGTPLPSDPLAETWYWHHYLRTGKLAPMIRFLIDNGASLLARSPLEDSHLHRLLFIRHNIGELDADTLETVKLLVDHGCDPLEANHEGITPVLIAVKNGHISAARYLLTQIGAPLPSDLLVTLKSWEKWTTVQMTRLLVENGDNVLARTSAGDSVFHIVLESFICDDEALELVKLLVAHGYDPLEANSEGKTPLHIAVRRGHISVVRYLLVQVGVPLPSDLLLTLDRWGRWGTAEMIRLLAENRANILARTDDGDSVLHIILQFFTADDETMFEVVKFLVDHGCDPLEADSRGETPVHIAVTHGSTSVTQYLLERGVILPPDLLLRLGIGRQSWERGWRTPRMLRFLVENGANPLAHTSDGDSVLHIVLCSFDDDNDALEAAKRLVGYGCNPLKANSDGKTPLHIAVEQDLVSAAQYLVSLGAPLPCDALFIALIHQQGLPIIKFLITQGADVLTKTSNGDTLLHVTTGALYPQNNDNFYHEGEEDYTLEVVKFLTKCGCDPAASNYGGETPLHIAVDRSHIKITKYLLSLNIPLPPDILFTAMHRNHYYRGQLDVIDILVSFGCDTQTPNSEGRTPLQLAVIQGDIYVVEYFLSVAPACIPPLEDLLSLAAELESPTEQGMMKRLFFDHLARSESPCSESPVSESSDLPPAKRTRYS